MMDPVLMQLLPDLRDPRDRAPLRLATDEELARVRAAVAAGTLLNRGDQVITREPEQCLVNEAAGVAYPVLDGIPILLSEEACILP